MLLSYLEIANEKKKEKKRQTRKFLSTFGKLNIFFIVYDFALCYIWILVGKMH